MNHATAPGAAESEEAVYRAGFAMGDHSARHLRRILRLHLTGWGMTEVADAAELAFGELISNLVRQVPGRRCQAFIFRLPDGEGVRVEVADSCTGCLA
ncbi:hypothetical protein ACWD7Y_02915 [Streptomyces drozdowiczii]